MLMYAAQSARIYFRRKYDSFMEFAGAGIFLGVIGFAVTGLVDDSTVSTMPVFYGLLGCGIAINLILSAQGGAAGASDESAEKAAGRPAAETIETAE